MKGGVTDDDFEVILININIMFLIILVINLTPSIISLILREKNDLRKKNDLKEKL